MKSYLLIICTFFIQISLLAQDKLPPLDKSPLDISYCPQGYTINKASGNSNEPLVARVIYSRPAVSNRKIFGGLIEFEKVWRFGANEATEIEFFKDVLIAGKKLKAMELKEESGIIDLVLPVSNLNLAQGAYFLKIE